MSCIKVGKMLSMVSVDDIATELKTSPTATIWVMYSVGVPVQGVGGVVDVT